MSTERIDEESPGPRPARPDASMDLLRTLRVEALDPSYARRAAARGGRPQARPRVLVPVLVVVGLLLGTALAGTLREAPAAAREREQLIARITEAESTLDQQQARGDALLAEVRRLRDAPGVLTPDQQQRADMLTARTGSEPLTGAGVRLTIEDGADPSVRGSRVVDTDVRMAANGLWAAGAEAVAVNGQRLTSRSAIRNAGQAITVNYRSITPPYVLEAIGDPAALQDGFGDSSGGEWLSGLQAHYGVRWQLEPARSLTLPADAGLRLDHARSQR